MTANILGIGLDNSIVNEIGTISPAKLITTDSCVEAINVLKLWDISTIVIDGQATQTLDRDIKKLLSATPITTQIVLINLGDSTRDTEKLTGLGIKLIPGSVSSGDLEPYLH